MKVYTMNEAAKELRISRRYFQDWLRDHPLDANGRPFYARLGRKYTFDENDLHRIREAAREEDRLRLARFAPKRTRLQAVVRSAQRTSEDSLAEALALLAKPRKR